MLLTLVIIGTNVILTKKKREECKILLILEVQEVTNEFIATEKWTIEKELVYFPLNLVDYFDGVTIYFKLTKKAKIQKG